MEEAQRALVTTEEAYLRAVRDQDSAEELRRRKALTAERLSTLDRRMRQVEDQVGTWALFAKCLSNDGLIALSIDDAGPALSRLANDLLLACYGPRFTVSLKTLVETARGEAREGFDIVVHDAESGESKSVTHRVVSFLSQYGLAEFNVPLDASLTFDQIVKMMTTWTKVPVMVGGRTVDNIDHVVVVFNGEVFNPNWCPLVGPCSDGYWWITAISVADNFIARKV